MLSWQLHTGPEKAELQELNARLHDYVRRVRELERENLLLEEELRRRHGGLWGAEDQAARWAAEEAAAEEARGLRLQLDELSWATALAEGERDALRRELREVRLLAEETRAARRRLDAELGARRRELQEALGARAALEALLGRLQAERRDLDAARERDLRELRAALAASLTVSYSARALLPAAPPPPLLREVRDSCSLLVAESWRDTVQVYEEQVRALEAALSCGEESRRQAEEESRLCAREAEALQRQALELEQLRALLEEELMRMREAYELQAQERQVRAQGPAPSQLPPPPPVRPAGGRGAAGLPGPTAPSPGVTRGWGRSAPRVPLLCLSTSGSQHLCSPGKWAPWRASEKCRVIFKKKFFFN